MYQRIDWLNRQAVFLHQQGQYAEAYKLASEACSLSQIFLDENDPLFVASLNNRGEMSRAMGNYSDAETDLRESLRIKRLFLPESHPSIATTLNNLGELCREVGKYEEAIAFFSQSLEIRRATREANDWQCLQSLGNLANLYNEIGNYVKAEPLFQEALKLSSSVLGEERRFFAQSLNGLANLYHETGCYEKALQLLSQACGVLLQEFGENYPDYITCLENLANLYHTIGKLAEAESIYQKTLELRRQNLGNLHPDVAFSLTNLANLYGSQRHTEAEEMLHQALEIFRLTVGEQSPVFANCLGTLAAIKIVTGDYSSAELLLHQVQDVLSTTEKKNHFDFASCLKMLAVVYVATSREREALILLEEAAVITDKMIGQIFSFGSESQRIALLRKTLKVDANMLLSLVYKYLSSDTQSILCGLRLILRRKAIEAEALIAQRDAVLSGKYPHLEQKLQELSKLREQIALKTLAGSGQSSLKAHNQILAEWESQKETLESELARQIPEINLEQKLREIDREVVAMALPEGSVLVEFVRFDVFDFKVVKSRGESEWKPAHYLAFVMAAKEPDNLQMIDLGEAEPIDAMIATFRAAITDEEEGRGVRDLGNVLPAPDSELYVAKGKELRKVLFDKLLDGIGDCKRLFISPDGDLTRLPFETLPTDDGEFLIDKYHISYLSVGRDVLRFDAASSGEPTAPLIIADPDFNLAGKDLPPSNEQTSGRISRDFDRSNLHFTPLPGTRIEGENIAEMLDVKPLLSTDALESSLKACQSPRILHIATHGFFLKDEKRDLNKDRRDLGMLEMSDNFGMGRFSASNLENPLLRSGLALAGVNTWLKDGVLPEEAEDGILTAEDVSGLDLLATELVVLSACETGLGEINVGEGVFGLRRAFVLAGAKTLVMSLWKVPDKQTQELMESFYQKILAGQPRSEALREAQLEIRKKHPHPADWGAFICQGNPNRLNDRR